MSWDICQKCARPVHKCKCPDFVEELNREIEVLRVEVERLTMETDRLNARDANPRALKMPTLSGMTPDAIRVVPESELP